MKRDAANPIPLYYRVQAILRAKIEAREYPDGSKLPSERELARAYRVSRITLRQALDALERERLIRREQGQGTFVVAGALRRSGAAVTLSGTLEELIRPEQIARIELLDVAEIPASPEVAWHLEIEADTPVRRVRRVFWAERDPFAFITNYLGPGIAARLSEQALASMPLFAILKREFGVEIGAARGTVEAALADAEVARVLRVEPMSPLLLIRRTVLGGDDRPISFNVIYAPSSRYRIEMNLRGSPGRRERRGPRARGR